jgi:hypothetical protein
LHIKQYCIAKNKKSLRISQAFSFVVEVIE